MAGEIDTIGEAVTAGLAGVAVEPVHGGKPAQSHGRCLNCGTPLQGSHCHHCGQKAHVHRSFGAIGHDLLHAVLHFDGKFWNTLPLLIWRPGDLTRRYIHGERASFISPLALFLFAVFLTYAVLASVGLGATGDFDVMGEAERQQAVNGAHMTMRREIDDIDGQIEQAQAQQGSTAELEAKRRELISGARAMGFVDDSGPMPMMRAKPRRDFVVTDIETGIPLIDEGVEKANENPGLLLYKFQANSYKFAWALIPLSMPFMWLLFPFSRRFHMFDHFVFVTYSISFMLLLFVALRFASYLPDAVGEPLFIGGSCYAVFHMYRQLRGAYRGSRWAAVVRTAILLLFSIFTVTLFLLLLLAMGIVG